MKKPNEVPEPATPQDKRRRPSLVEGLNLAPPRVQAGTHHGGLLWYVFRRPFRARSGWTVKSRFK